MADRALAAAVAAHIAGRKYKPVFFYEGEYDSSGTPAYLRLFTGIGTLSWDGKTWTGGADLLSFAPIRESTSLEAIGWSVTLSGLPTDKLSIALQSMKKNKIGKLWLGFFRPKAHLLLPGATGNYASTPDSAALSITGDIDIRAKVAADDWTPAAELGVVGKWTGSGNQRSFSLALDGPQGQLRLRWSEDGTTGTDFTIDSTASPSISDGEELWVRATLDVDDGGGNNVVKFYTSSDYDPVSETGTWTQLGSTVTTVGATSIFDSSAPVSIGAVNAGTSFLGGGKVYYAEVRNGIDGTVVAQFDPLKFKSSDLTATMDTGEVWTVHQSGSSRARIVPEGDELIGDPFQIRRGRFNRAPITRDPAAGTMTIDVEYVGPLHRLMTPNERRYTHDDQQLRLAGDRGFDQVPELQDAVDLWGDPAKALPAPRPVWDPYPYMPGG